MEFLESRVERVESSKGSWIRGTDAELASSKAVIRMSPPDDLVPPPRGASLRRLCEDHVAIPVVCLTPVIRPRTLSGDVGSSHRVKVEPCLRCVSRKGSAIMLSVTALVMASSVVLGQADGEKAFKSYTDLAVGGTWITTVDGQQFENTYERILDGKFVRLTAKAAGGFPASVAILGVDPVTKKFTQWEFDADGGTAIGTSYAGSRRHMGYEWQGKGPKGNAKSKSRLTFVDANTAKLRFSNRNWRETSNLSQQLRFGNAAGRCLEGQLHRDLR